MHEALHPRDNVNRLYVSRKWGGKGFASIQDSVDASIRRLEDDIKKSKERLINIYQKQHKQHKDQLNNKN